MSKDGFDIPAWLDGTLRPVDKLRVHHEGLRHPAVSVFVMRDSQMLLQQRAMGKYHTPGLWANTCCTHPNWAEPPMTCATRRLSEELGITGLTLTHRGTVEYRAEVGDNMIEHEVVDVFVAEADHNMPLAPNPDEVQAIRWVAPDVLQQEITTEPQRFTPWLRIYLQDHASMILGVPDDLTQL